MNNDLVWRFDVAVFEWLILLAMLVILAIVGAVVTRQILGAFREQSDRTVDRSSASSRWHTESTEKIFETFETNSSGLSKEEAGQPIRQIRAKPAPRYNNTWTISAFFLPVP